MNIIKKYVAVIYIDKIAHEIGEPIFTTSFDDAKKIALIRGYKFDDIQVMILEQQTNQLN